MDVGYNNKSSSSNGIYIGSDFIEVNSGGIKILQKDNLYIIDSSHNVYEFGI